jgi:hypothetical protein
VSRLRARCPDCHGLTAVALGADYECHACGRTFRAAVARVEPAPALELPWPDAGAGEPPERPIVLCEGPHDGFARSLGALLVRLGDPPEPELPRALAGATGVYVVLEEPFPRDAARLAGLLCDLAPVLGAGVRGGDAELVTRLLRQLGL